VEGRVRNTNHRNILPPVPVGLTHAAPRSSGLVLDWRVAEVKAVLTSLLGAVIGPRQQKAFCTDGAANFTRLMLEPRWRSRTRLRMRIASRM
jgi:hypothetical protein